MGLAALQLSRGRDSPRKYAAAPTVVPGGRGRGSARPEITIGGSGGASVGAGIRSSRGGWLATATRPPRSQLHSAGTDMKFVVKYLGLEIMKPVMELKDHLHNLLLVNLMVMSKIHNHGVIGIESMLHHPLTLEDLVFHCFEPGLLASLLLWSLNIPDVKQTLTHLNA
ncbi:hypothetical protein D1007_59781 [Hordeum vulgare]|nr:hypothetical protein D1007_59781 [Hordeum vulgare]